MFYSQMETTDDETMNTMQMRDFNGFEKDPSASDTVCTSLPLVQLYKCRSEVFLAKFLVAIRVFFCTISMHLAYSMSLSAIELVG